MIIQFDNSYESNILKRIIDGYEKSVEKSGMQNTEDFDTVINQVKSAIDSHEIDQLFDYIGPLHCVSCRLTWTSIIGKDAVSAQCPRCEHDVHIPQEKFVRKIR